MVELNARFTLGTVALALLARGVDAGLVQEGQQWAFVLREPAGLVDNVHTARVDPSGAALLWSDSRAALNAVLQRTLPTAVFAPS